jgi:hypothetical protein
MLTIKPSAGEEEKPAKSIISEESDQLHDSHAAVATEDDGSTDNDRNPAPPLKDGGTRAWLQVAGSFLVFGK